MLWHDEVAIGMQKVVVEDAPVLDRLGVQRLIDNGVGPENSFDVSREARTLGQHIVVVIWAHI